MSKTNIEIAEEKEKDKIVQEIYDILEANRWGDGCDLMVIKIIFVGKLNIKPLVVTKNKPVRCLGNTFL